MNGHDIVPTRRNMHFELPAHRICDWYQHCHYLSHWKNGMSIMLPVFERFIVQSIRAYEHAIKDQPLLSRQIKALIAQEAVHAREHRYYNALIDGAGLPATRLEQRWKTLFDHTLNSRWVSDRTRLAVTLMFEHHGAMLAEQWLHASSRTRDAEPGYMALWNWHGLEETEHKSVSLDLWRHVVAPGPFRYGLRTVTVILVSVPLWYMTFDSYLRLMWADRHSTAHLHGVWRMSKAVWGPEGLVFGNARRWLAYFKPGFEPWKEGDLASLQPLETLSWHTGKIPHDADAPGS